MRTLFASFYATGTALLLAALGGCSRGDALQTMSPGRTMQQQSIGAASSSGAMLSPTVLTVGVTSLQFGRPGPGFVDSVALAKNPLRIAVSDASNEVVDVYNRAGTQLARLTGFFQPQGLSSDVQGDLFVADTSNQRIQVYAPGLTSSPATLSDPTGFPAGVDSISDGSIVAVTNIYGYPCCTPGNIIFFTHGQPSKTIADARIVKPFFCAFDGQGNLFVDGQDANGAFAVGEIIGGARGTALTPLATGNVLEGPGGIEVTSSGRIAILDQNAATLYTYEPPKNGSLGRPIRTTHLAQAVDPVTFAFTQSMTDLFTADAGIFAAQEFAYPAGGSARSTINVGGQAIGVAVFPAQYPHV